VPHQLPQRLVAEFDHSRILAAHRTNKVLPFTDVTAATLFRGRTAHGLNLTMTNGRRHKLLWLVRDPAFHILSETLPITLQDRLIAR
jgi:hypothetical protein